MSFYDTNEIINLLYAYKEGKTIQMRTNPNRGWEDVTDPIWNFGTTEYRIKPSIEPYSTAEEICIAAREHGPYFYADKNAAWFLAKSIEGNEIDLDTMSSPISFKKFAETYTWQDGTPCGKPQYRLGTVELSL